MVNNKVKQQKVLLVDVDSTIPNMALMKLSTFHKQKGNVVEIVKLKYSGVPGRRTRTLIDNTKYDKVYASIIFTPNKEVLQFKDESLKNYQVGGTGTFDFTIKLTDEVEDLEEDFSLYPENDEMIGFTSRGCIRNCHFCHTKGTQVLTNKGLKNIEDIRPGDEVLSNGYFNKVNDINERDYNGEIIEFNTLFNKVKCGTTIEHKFPIKFKNKIKEKELGNIDLNDNFIIDIPISLKKRSLDLRNFIRKDIGRIKNPIKRTILKGKQLELFCELAGFYLAEGSISKHNNRPYSYTIALTFSKEEEKYIKRCQYIIKTLFGIHSSYNINNHDSTIQLNCGNKELAYLLMMFFGKGAKNKFISKELLELDDKYVLNLIKGYLLGDGSLFKSYEERYSIRSGSMSYSLSLTIALLLRRMGFSPNIYARKIKDSNIDGRIIHSDNTFFSMNIEKIKEVKRLAKDIWNKKLNIKLFYDYPLKRKKEIVDLIDKHPAKSINKRALAHGIVFQTYYAWKEQIKNEKVSYNERLDNKTTMLYKRKILPYSGKVYNISVNKIHKYSVNGILTNNCFVRRKEGFLCKYRPWQRIVKTAEKFGLKKIRFLDNNFLANEHCEETMQGLIDAKVSCSFNEGLDFRLIDDKKAELLSKLKYYPTEFIFAFDDIAYLPIIDKQYKILRKHITKDWKIKFYCYVHPDMPLSATVKRLEWARKNKALIYIMKDKACYSSKHKNFYRDLCSWANAPGIYKNYTFMEHMIHKTKNMARRMESVKLYNEGLGDKK